MSACKVCTLKDSNPSMEYSKSSRGIFFEHQKG
ncbi:hypothetical protein ABFA07_017468 [Porites harrisoni]